MAIRRPENGVDRRRRWPRWALSLHWLCRSPPGDGGFRGGVLTVVEGMDLLSDVAQENTQWSVVYDLSHGGTHVVMGRGYVRTHTFQLGREPLSSEGDG